MAKYKLGDRKDFDRKSYAFHSMSHSQNSLEGKKSHAKNKGFNIRTVKEGDSWSLWTRKHK